MSVVIPIISEFNSKGIDRARKEFGQLEGFSKKAGYAVSRAALPAAGALTTLGAAAFKAAQKASDLEEVQNKVGVIFGSSAKEVEAFAKTAATNLGQSSTQALNAAATFATFGKSAGLAGEELVDFSTDFVTLATDLSSFNNTSPEEAINAIGSALRGEAEPLRKYGVLLDDATLRQAALSLGLVKTTKEALTPQNKVLAAQKVIYDQTGLAQGDFMRTSDSMANQQKTLAASVENLNTQIGKAFVPIIKDAIPIINEYADIISGLITETEGADFQTNKWVKSFLLLNKYLNPASGLIKNLKIVERNFRGLFKANEQNQQVTSNTGTKVLATQIAFSKLRVETDKDTVATDKSSEAKKKNAERLAKQKKAAEELAQALKEAREAVAEQFTVALEKANTVLAEAQTKFDSFKASTSAAVMSAINFGSAQSDVVSNVKDLNDAIADRTKAQANLTKAMKGDDTEAQAEAMRELVEANAAVEKANSKPMTFFDNLKKQAAKAKDFGVLVNRLVAGGISETALSQVLDAGVDAGTSIAEEILAGGQDAITGPEGVNTIVQAAKDLADKTGELAAKKYFQAGVDAGKALVAGIQAVVDKYTPMINAPGVTPSGVAGLGATAGTELSGVFDPSVLGNLDWSTIFQGITIDVGGLATLASGGLVTSPTIALIGEGGESEAVIPLSKMGEMGGGGGNITINVNGGDPNAVVDALRSYMFRNGSVPIRVSG